MQCYKCMDNFGAMHTVPGFLLVATHSHSHSNFSVGPAQIFVELCRESDRGIDQAKNNFFFFLSHFSGRAVPDAAHLQWAGGKLVCCRIRRWGWESWTPSCHPSAWLCLLKLIGISGMSFQKRITVVRTLAWFSILLARGSSVL